MNFDEIPIVKIDLKYGRTTNTPKKYEFFTNTSFTSNNGIIYSWLKGESTTFIMKIVEYGNVYYFYCENTYCLEFNPVQKDGTLFYNFHSDIFKDVTHQYERFLKIKNFLNS